MIQLELRPDAPDEPETGETEQAAQSVLLRYLTMRLAGDAAADAADASGRGRWVCPRMTRLVPLRFAPLHAPERFDERAGLVIAARAQYRAGECGAGRHRADRAGKAADWRMSVTRSAKHG